MHLLHLKSLPETQDGFIGFAEVSSCYQVYRQRVQLIKNQRNFNLDSFNRIINVYVDLLYLLTVALSCSLCWSVYENNHEL